MPLSVLYSFLVRGFLDGSVVKNPPANAGDADSIPGSGRSPGEGNGNPLHYSCLGNPIDRRSLAGQNLWDYKRLRHNLASKQQQQLLISPTFEHSLSVAAKSLQSCPTLCNPRDGSPPGSPVPGILQARTLEWVAISFSNAWKWKVKKKRKVKVKSLSHVRLSGTPWTATHQAPPSMGFSRQEYWSGVPLPSPEPSLSTWQLSPWSEKQLKCYISVSFSLIIPQNLVGSFISIPQLTNCHQYYDNYPTMIIFLVGKSLID